jgi:Family of unknown function (DUF6508)
MMGWSRFRERFPNSSGIVTLSRVIFDSGQNHALVYVGNQKDWLSGSGIVFDEGGVIQVRVDRARLTPCIKLIMASVRYQRFCDGHLGEVIKSGHITAVLRKLKQLADARLENTKVD